MEPVDPASFQKLQNRFHPTHSDILSHFSIPASESRFFFQQIENDESLHSQKIAFELAFLHSRVEALHLPFRILPFPYEKDEKVMTFFEEEFLRADGSLNLQAEYQGPKSISLKEVFGISQQTEWDSMRSSLQETPLVFAEFWFHEKHFEVAVATTKRLFVLNSTTPEFRVQFRKAFADIFQSSKLPKIFTGNLVENVLFLQKEFGIYLVNAFSIETALLSDSTISSTIWASQQKPQSASGAALVSYCNNAINASLELRAKYGHTAFWALFYARACQESLVCECKNEGVTEVMYSYQVIQFLCMIELALDRHPGVNIRALIKLVKKPPQKLEQKPEIPAASLPALRAALDNCDDLCQSWYLFGPNLVRMLPSEDQTQELQKQEPSKQRPPQKEPPKELPKKELPKQEPPKQELHKKEPPKQELQKKEPPKQLQANPAPQQQVQMAKQEQPKQQGKAQEKPPKEAEVEELEGDSDEDDDADAEDFDDHDFHGSEEGEGSEFEEEDEDEDEDAGKGKLPKTKRRILRVSKGLAALLASTSPLSLPGELILQHIDTESRKFSAARLLRTEDKSDRNNILQMLQEILETEHPGAKFHLFGSSISGFGAAGGDLDLSLIPPPKVTISLKNVDKFLTKACDGQYVKITNRTHIPWARVPIFKFDLSFFGKGVFQCDISIGNELGIYNSQLLATYGKCDERVVPMTMVLKAWAKSLDIGDASKSTISPYAHVLLCINFLQIKGILPCLQALVPPDAQREIVDHRDITYLKDTSSLPKSSNTQSIGELLVEFFHYYGYVFNFLNDVACVRLGKVIPLEDKIAELGSTVWAPKYIYIEDPFIRDHNLGRNVSEPKFWVIVESFREAHKILSTLKPDTSVLSVLFGDYNSSAIMATSQPGQMSVESLKTRDQPPKSTRRQQPSKAPAPAANSQRPASAPPAAGAFPLRQPGGKPPATSGGGGGGGRNGWDFRARRNGGAGAGAGAEGKKK